MHYLSINPLSDIPKYLQLVNCIQDAVAKNHLKFGDALPSVNVVCDTLQLSRDTVFKAYSLLKEQKVIESVPNKGYFIASETRRVLLVLDTFKAYKEVLYHAFIDNLPDNVIADVQFHHYNIDNFKTIINNSVGKYFKYIVMNFDNAQIPAILPKIDTNKLLLIDWNIHSDPQNSYVCQDFGLSFYEALLPATDLFRKYQKLVFVYPSFTFHPKEALVHFEKFCQDKNINFEIIQNAKDFILEKNTAYICVSDRILGSFLEQCKDKNLEPGVDVGFLSYNDTPMKKFIYKGISVVSTDFKEMGTKIAEFVTTEEPMHCYVSTKLILRESL